MLGVCAACSGTVAAGRVGAWRGVVVVGDGGRGRSGGERQGVTGVWSAVSSRLIDSRANSLASALACGTLAPPSCSQRVSRVWYSSPPQQPQQQRKARGISTATRTPCHLPLAPHLLDVSRRTDTTHRQRRGACVITHCPRSGGSCCPWERRGSEAMIGSGGGGGGGGREVTVQWGAVANSQHRGAYPVGVPLTLLV